MTKSMKFKLQWYDETNMLFIVWVNQVDLWRYTNIPYRVIQIMEV